MEPGVQTSPVHRSYPKNSHIFQDPWEQTLQCQHGQTLGHKEPLDGARPVSRVLCSDAQP